MPAKVNLLVSRREDLVRRAAANRVELAEVCALLEQPLRVVDTAFNLVQALRSRPWLVGLGSSLIGVLGFRKSSLPIRLFSIWRGLRGAYSLWRKFRG